MDVVIAQYKAATTSSDRWKSCMDVMDRFRTLFSKKQVDIQLLLPLVQVDTDCGAIVMLGLDRNNKRFIVVKEYLHESGSWKLPAHVLRQLEAASHILAFQEEKKTHIHCLQECLDVQISQNITHFVYKYYPVTFDMLFRMHRTPLWDFALEKTRELLLAIQTLHSAKVAHRDIKPGNICFDKQSRLVLIDFDSSASDNLWRRKTVPVCSLQTRAPEQLRLEITKQADNSYDARVGDWWAAGCVIAYIFLNSVDLFQVRSANWTLPEFLEDILDICSQLGSASPTHARVRALQRSVSPNVMALLCGLLNVDATKRELAATTYLESVVSESTRQ